MPQYEIFAEVRFSVCVRLEAEDDSRALEKFHDIQADFDRITQAARDIEFGAVMVFELDEDEE